jgi:hypothetical protein
VASTPLIAKHALAAQIEAAPAQAPSGSRPQDASTTDLMQAVAQVAREQLSQTLGRDPGASERANQGAPCGVPVDGVPDGAHTVQRAGRAAPHRQGSAGPGAQHAHTLEDVAERRARRSPGQWRPGPPCGVLSGLPGYAGPAIVRVRDPLRIRHVRARTFRGAAQVGVPGPVASGRHTLGVSRGPTSRTRCGLAAGSSISNGKAQSGATAGEVVAKGL